MFRYTAIIGLERLGEGSAEWGERLAALSRDRNPIVRLRAWAALAKRGNEAHLAKIIRTATRARDVRLRAEALWALGELDARRHFAILQRALLTDHAEYEYRMPAAEEAASALLRLRTPEALTILVQAALCGPQGLWWFLIECLARTDLFATPPSPQRVEHSLSWRRDYHRGWLLLLDEKRAFSPILGRSQHPCRWWVE
jgi:HEAT repeat protein